jgi:RNA:NAD 2'-phosphotransferase (TPT1/KptA family)
MRLYHGTSERKLDDIEKAGFIKAPYLADDYTEALEWAEKAARNDKSIPVIIEIEVDEKTADECFRIDSNLLIERIDYPDWVTERYGPEEIAEKETRTLKKKGIKPWKWSLEHVGAVESTCDISARHIKRITRE